MTSNTTMRILLLLGVSLLMPSLAVSHCDGMDGPVVKAAQQALASENVNLVLIWVKKGNEAEVRRAFDETIAVRKLSPRAQALADRYFFETLVRLHRAGEGVPYTGLKPAGRDLGPAIPAADKALDSGSLEPALKLLTEAAQEGARKYFRQVQEKKNFNTSDLDAGRDYVKAYVEFIHYVEGIWEAARNPAEGHSPEEHAVIH